MSQKKPSDDPSSAPESGTNRNETTGNQPAGGGNRPLHSGKDAAGNSPKGGKKPAKDDPSVAGEER